MKKNDWLIIAIYVVPTVLAIVLFILYIKGVLSADIPWWLKLNLLSGK